MSLSLLPRLAVLLWAVLLTGFAGAQTDCDVVGGDLLAPDGSGTYLIFDDADRTFTPLIANPDEIAGETQKYVIYEFIFGFRILDIVDADALPLELPFNADGVFLVSYDGEFPELQVGAELSEIVDAKPCADRGSDVRVDEGCTITVGTLEFIDGTAPEPIVIDGDPDPIGFSETGNDSAEGSPFYLVTDTDTTILAISNSNFIDFDAFGEGTKLVWLLRTTESNARGRGLEVGENAADLTGCFALSNALSVETTGSADDEGDDECTADGGMIAFLDGETDTTIVVDGTPDPLDVTLTADASGANTAWVITDAEANILALPPAPPFDLDGAGVGTCLVWYLAWDGELAGATVGANAADLEGCFDLSNPLTVDRVAPDGGGDDDDGECTADAGTLVGADAPVELDSNGVRFTATVGEAPTVPEGYEVVYVLTTSENLVVQDIKSEPSFFVQNPNVYRVHTLVAELDDADDPDFLDASIIEFGKTRAGAVLDVVAEAGICADLFVAGAPFDVVAGDGSDGEGDGDDGECTADAGTLVGADAPVELDSNGVRFTATVGEAPTVPEGYEVVYVLTTSDNLVIQDIKPEPSFFVINPNVYRVHTLVAELDDADDADFLDASIIEFGKTHAGAVLDVIAGAGICADLFVEGAAFDVVAGEAGCAADGGTIAFADGSTDTTIVVDGTPDPLDVTVAGEVSGANTAWVITDAEANILALPPAPPFDLDGAGVGTCLIWYLAWDGALSGATVGANAADLEGCFDLSNPLTVDRVEADGGACAAQAGTLVGADEPVALGPNGVRFTAIAGVEPTVPEGYEVVYVLTTSENLVIQDIKTEPSFYVLDPNVYRVHTLVAELGDSTDADFLDASIIEFGKTRAGAVLDVIAEAGICADLFVEGAAFDVVGGVDVSGLIAKSTQNGAGSDLQVTLTPTEAPVERVEVYLVDRTGRLVATQRLGRIDAETTALLPVGGQGEGLYVVSVRTDRGMQSEVVRVH